MGIIRKFREWREAQDGTLTGPAIDATKAKIGKLTDNLDANGNDIQNVGALETADFISVDDYRLNPIAVETPTAYQSGPAHGEVGDAFFGATLSPDGRVIFAPFDSSNVGIFDPTDDSYTSGPAHGEGGGAFIGATLSPDGRVIFAPFNSSNVGIFDPANDSYISGPAHGEGNTAFIGATLSPDGRVIFAPRDSSNVGTLAQLLDIATAKQGSY